MDYELRWNYGDSALNCRHAKTRAKAETNRHRHEVIGVKCAVTATQKPYVKRQVDGNFYDKNGNIIPRNSPEAHIPLQEFKF